MEDSCQYTGKGIYSGFQPLSYEDILIQQVHKWLMRIGYISAWLPSMHLKNTQFDNNTLVLKFFMHISKTINSNSLRKGEPEKNWKHNPNDWEERKLWNEYTKAYEYALNHSSIPWHIVPVDNRWYRNYFIASVIVRELEALNMKLPVLDKNTLLADNSDD